ncbi:MAG: Crp/Fnr family transcriptional regulator [Terriglobales bacterium]|jgi:CRP-like cAMP-binding protein
MNSRTLFSLPDKIRHALNQIAEAKAFAEGSRLFEAGEDGIGIYLIRSGLVGLALPNEVELLHIGGAGSVLGLPSTVGSRPYSLTAVALEPVQAGFIPSSIFLKLMQQDVEICLAVTEAIAGELYETRHEAGNLLDRTSLSR